ncbi:MAG: hypothetical protein IIY70_03480 [Oscillospiraceae bacterium]|nr:hypothetical protein [Oscillospiraceae bacterium]
MNERKRTRLFGRILTTTALFGLLSTTAFAGSPKANFYFDFGWGSDTQYSAAAKKTDAGTAGGSHADVAVTQDTKITYTVVKETSKGKYVVYSKSKALYSEDYRQTLSLDYTKYATNSYFELRGESDWGRYGSTTKGNWWP